MTAVNGSSCLFFYFVSPNNFAQYLTVRLMFDVTRSASLSLSEGTLSLMVRKLKMDYGRQRVLSSLAPMLVTPLAGLLLDLDQESKYFTLFAFYFALKVASVAVTFCLDLTFKTQSKLVLYNIKDLLSKRSILRFLTIFATLGAVWGIIETYLYLYLNQIGISKQNIGFSQSISTVTGEFQKLKSYKNPNIIKYLLCNTVYTVQFATRRFPCFLHEFLIKFDFKWQFWNLLVTRIPKHPLHVWFDEVLAELFKVDSILTRPNGLTMR